MANHVQAKRWPSHTVWLTVQADSGLPLCHTWRCMQSQHICTGRYWQATTARSISFANEQQPKHSALNSGTLTNARQRNPHKKARDGMHAAMSFDVPCHPSDEVQCGKGLPERTQPHQSLTKAASECLMPCKGLQASAGPIGLPAKSPANANRHRSATLGEPAGGFSKKLQSIDCKSQYFPMTQIPVSSKARQEIYRTFEIFDWKHWKALSWCVCTTTKPPGATGTLAGQSGRRGSFSSQGQCGVVLTRGQFTKIKAAWPSNHGKPVPFMTKGLSPPA